MDAERFAYLARTLLTASSRRRFLAGATSGLLTLVPFGVGSDLAARKQRKNKKKKNKEKDKQRNEEPQPSQPPKLVYVCPGPGIGDDPNDGTLRIAQTFRPGSSGSLRRITFPIDKAPDSLGDYIVQLLAVDPGTGVPSHLAQGVLAEVIIPNSAVQAGTTVTLTAEFNGPLLQQGALYAAALSRPGPDGSLNYYWSGDGSACSGAYFASLNGGPFSEAPALDTVVSVFIA
jgi:hypothetical protein